MVLGTKRLAGKAVFLFLGLCVMPGFVESQTQSEGLSVEVAKKEGGLVIYHSPSLQDMRQLVDKFRERNPAIKTEQFRATVGSLYNRIVTEARGGVFKADVIILNAIYGYLLQKQGIVQKYQVPESGSVHAAIRDAESYYNPLFVNTHVIAYNTRLVRPSDAPKAYQDLLQSRWKGKIVVINTLFEWYLGMQKYLGESAADDFLRNLGRQDVSLRSERTLVSQLVAAGEYPIAVGVYAHEIEKLKEEKAPIDWVGAPPVVTNMPAMFIAARAPHPNAARLFVNFALSREGQTVVRDLKRITVRTDVKPFNPRLIEGLELVVIPPGSVEKFDSVAVKFRGFLEQKAK